MDLEGTEVCDWLNSIGITGALLKYRVPKREGEERSLAALQDAQRALGLLRYEAADLGIDPKRMGVIGFSAGAHVAAALSNPRAPRNYPKVDEADTASCRPDFCLLIYPAYLTVKEANDRDRAGSEPHQQHASHLHRDGGGRPDSSRDGHVLRLGPAPGWCPVRTAHLSHRWTWLRTAPDEEMPLRPGPSGAPSGCAAVVSWNGPTAN